VGKSLFANSKGQVEKKRVQHLLPWCPLKMIQVTSYGNVVEAGYQNIQAFMDLCSQEWFHGEIGSEDARKRLDGKEAGMFLVRFSSSSPGLYGLDFTDGKRVHPLRITPKFGLKGEDFKSLAEMVEFYKQNNYEWNDEHTKTQCSIKFTNGCPKVFS